MKNLAFLLIAFLLFSCTNTDKKRKFSKSDTSATQINTQKKSITDASDGKDTVNINIDLDDADKHTKTELRKILEKNPELNEKYISSPDECYAKRTTENDDYLSELGQDEYYALYAYFLRQKNSEKQYNQQREKLIDIYRDINSIYQKLAGGGTYFGHQYTRILGYAEYSICLGKGNNYYIKNYNIAGQKNLYINSLKQHMYDEVNNDGELSPKEKSDKQLELLKTITDIDRLITNYFYLKMAERFQYSHY